MIGAGAMLLQCLPRTSAFSEVPSRISMKSYLKHTDVKKKIIPCGSQIEFALSLMQQEGITRGKEIKGEHWRVDKHR